MSEILFKIFNKGKVHKKSVEKFARFFIWWLFYMAAHLLNHSINDAFMEKFFLCYEFILLSLSDRFRCPFKLSIYDWSSYLDLISFYDYSTRMERWFKAIRERDFFMMRSSSEIDVAWEMCAYRCVNWPLLMNQFARWGKKVSFPFNF